jgi:hypothetical protein
MTTNTGFQLRDTLLRESGLQFDDFKHALHECTQKALTTYWNFKRFPEQSPNRIRQLVSDGMSGGQIGRARVISQLKKINFGSNVIESDLNTISTEILNFLSPFASKLNYARLRTRCVLAHLDNLSDNFGLINLQGLPETERETFINYSKVLLNTKVTNLSQLQEWSINVHKLLLSVSNTFDILNGEKDSGISSRAKKGFIASKNIPTYKKHWISFIGEIYNKEFGISQDNSDTLEKLITDLENISKKESREMIEYIESLISDRFQNTANDDVGQESSDYLKLEIPLDHRTLKVTFNKSGIDKSLIESLIKSLSIQLGMKRSGVGADSIGAKIKNGQSFIEVNLKDAKNSDIAQVKKVLELL